MTFFDHCFRNFKSVERICWTCGYVLPRTDTEAESVEWMLDHEGQEVWCGGAWHIYDRRPIKSKQS